MTAVARALPIVAVFCLLVAVVIVASYFAVELMTGEVDERTRDDMPPMEWTLPPQYFEPCRDWRDEIPPERTIRTDGPLKVCDPAGISCVFIYIPGP